MFLISGDTKATISLSLPNAFDRRQSGFQAILIAREGG